MTKQNGVTALTAILALAFASPGQAQAEPAGDDRPPNVIYFYADDLGYGDLGSYGQQRISTPRLDALAAQGIRFSDHYSGAPVCAPSRAALLTGRHMGTAFIRNNREVQPWGQWPLTAEHATLSELVKDAGYATACIGKWGLGPRGSEGDPNDRGFDLFFGYNCQRHAHTYYPEFLVRNDREIDLRAFNGHVPRQNNNFLMRQVFDSMPEDPRVLNQPPFMGEMYSADLMIEEALRFVRENRDGPFFLYYATPVPHIALQVPHDSLQQYLGLAWDEQPYLGETGYFPHPTPRAAYAAMVTRMDRDLGRLVDLIEQLGLANDTVIMFSSDNGPTGSAQVDTDFFQSSAGLRGLKGSLYEGGLRVPMLARWDGHIEAGSVTDLPSYQVDVLPTVLELIGRQELTPDDINGISFAPALLGMPGQQKKHEYLYWERSQGQGWQALRAGQWKLHRHGTGGNDFRVELYNLADDRSEQRDLAEAHPERVAQMQQWMQQAHRPSELFPLRMLGER